MAWFRSKPDVCFTIDCSLAILNERLSVRGTGPDVVACSDF